MEQFIYIFLVPLNQRNYTFKEKKKKDTIVLTVILKEKNWYQKTLSTQVEVFMSSIRPGKAVS